MSVEAQQAKDVMWVTADPKNEIESFKEGDKLPWVQQLALLSGYCMQHKGIMEGEPFIQFQLEDGEPKNDMRICQQVETLIEPSDLVGQMSMPASKVIRATHKGKRTNLGAAYRALEQFARESGLDSTGWGRLTVIRGAEDTSDPSEYLTLVQLYVR